MSKQDVQRVKVMLDNLGKGATDQEVDNAVAKLSKEEVEQLYDYVEAEELKLQAGVNHD